MQCPQTVWNCSRERSLEHCHCHAFSVPNFRKIPAPIKIKSALPRPPQTQNTPPQKTRNFMDMEVFLQKNAEVLGAHKIGAAISGPRIADTNFTDTRIFLIIQVFERHKQHLLALREHSRDTFCALRSPGPEGPRRHSVRHSRRHPGFRGHSRGHPRRHLRRARETPVAGRGGRKFWGKNRGKGKETKKNTTKIGRAFLADLASFPQLKAEICLKVGRKWGLGHPCTPRHKTNTCRINFLGN